MGAITREDVIGRIITLQSNQFDGYYVNGKRPSGWDFHNGALVAACEYTALPNAVWSRFIVHEGPHDSIILESLLSRNCYITMSTPWPDERNVVLRYALNPPTDENSASSHWRVVNASGDDVVWLKNCGMEERFFLGAEFSYRQDIKICSLVDAGESSSKCLWRLAIGPGQGMTDGFERVASLRNDLDTPVKLKYERTIGTSVEQATSTRLTAELSLEMHLNFSMCNVNIGGSTNVRFAKEWSSAESRTWSESIRMEMEVDVQSKSRVMVYQLQGTYGPLKTYSNNFKLNDQ